MSISPREAQNALQLLAEAAVNRTNDLDAYPMEDLKSDTDEETDSSTPTYDSFYQSGGSPAILKMCNFAPDEFQEVWMKFRQVMLNNWNTGRGRKTKHGARDMLFIVLSCMKHGGQWDFLGRMFKIKGPSLRDLVEKFIRMAADVSYETLVLDAGAACPMERILKSNRAFKKYPYARYATDVTFQHTNRPTGNHQESKKYFSGKHKLYGYKTEVSVLRIGLAIVCSVHFADATADIDNVYSIKDEHLLMLKKSEVEDDILDAGALSDKYSKRWACLFDKGYQGVADSVRGIVPTKKGQDDI